MQPPIRDLSWHSHARCPECNRPKPPGWPYKHCAKCAPETNPSAYEVRLVITSRAGSPLGWDWETILDVGDDVELVSVNSHFIHGADMPWEPYIYTSDYTGEKRITFRARWIEGAGKNAREREVYSHEWDMPLGKLD